MLRVLLISGVLLGFTCHIALAADEGDAPKSIASFTDKMTSYPGYVPFYWDAEAGKIYLEIATFDEELLYLSSLSSGIGSNDIGLDRGQLGGQHVVRFERVGPKVLLRQTNYDYRALSDNAAERAAVQQAFAESVLWGFSVALAEGDRVLVDATDFLLRDAHDVSGRIKEAKQGSYKVDASRSSISLERTRNFEENSEFDAVLTFTGDPEGAWIRSVTPDARAVTVHQHHSFIKLPDNTYVPREFDPRSGVFATQFRDYASPISAPLVKRWANRHRLRKVDPAAAISDPVEPIIYYLDPGTPEPIRSALLDGAKWWNEAFETAGYRDAFQVRMLPEGADPMDIRYNVIQWVHRSTRGWSYGMTVDDPRTGEIIKGHVTLGSLRVRQNYLIAQALTGKFAADGNNSKELEALALARLRQLSAHEIGHTLGLAHNFASSADGRLSVMDYPHPLVKLNPDGSVDLSEAYDTGIGEWDKVAIAYAYQDFPEGVDEKAGLNAIIESALDRDMQFITDADARPIGGAHPHAHLWDNGANAAEELQRVLDVRVAALSRFGEHTIPKGTPMDSLEELLVPLYLFHRYQTEAAIKLVGGVRYSYALRGDGQVVTEVVSAEEQRDALDAILKTLSAETLTLPEEIIEIIPPRSFGNARHREAFDVRTGLTLDPVAMAETAADMTLEVLLHPARANRIVEQNARDRSIPGLDQVFDTIVEATWAKSYPLQLEGEVQRAVNERVLEHLMRLSQDEAASQSVRDRAYAAIVRIDTMINNRRDFEAVAIHPRIQRFLEEPGEFKPESAPDLPPGSPIGFDEFCGMTEQ